MSEVSKANENEVPVSAAQRVIGDFAPFFVELTDDVLFAQVWTRPGLSPRDRSLVTITSLVTGGNLDKLKGHIQRGIDNGLTREEVIEAITHTAFYAGWPRASSAMVVAKELFSE